MRIMEYLQGDDDENEDAMEVEDTSTSDEDELEEEEEIEHAKQVAALLKNEKNKTTPTSSARNISDSLAELNMDAYDEEDEDDEMNRILGAGHPGMAYYANPDDDPYLNRQDGDDSEDDELEYKESDLLIAAARNEEDISHLEIWVYEEGDAQNAEGNIYVHHSLLLPAFPLCLAWGPCDPIGGGVEGNFMAVGSFEPGIEIWNLDVLDAVEPVVTLGGADYEAARSMDATASAKKKKKKNKKIPQIPVKPGSHEDAVLGLAWNQEFCNVLASGSADSSIKIWDVTTQQATQTITLHTDKVQSLRWKPIEASLLMSGGFDRKLFLSDLRVPEQKASEWSISADVEALNWDPHNPETFAVAAEDGYLTIFDTRKGSEPIERFAAHAKATTSVSFCPCLDGVFVTGSTDATVKLWKKSGGAHQEVCCQKMGVGSVFSAEYCRDSPMLVAAGGAAGSITVWDTNVLKDDLLS